MTGKRFEAIEELMWYFAPFAHFMEEMKVHQTKRGIMQFELQKKIFYCQVFIMFSYILSPDRPNSKKLFIKIQFILMTSLNTFRCKNGASISTVSECDHH